MVDLAEHALVGAPRLADQHKAEEVHRELRTQSADRGREPAIEGVGRDADVEDEQGQRERDHAVAEALQSSHLDEDLA